MPASEVRSLALCMAKIALSPVEERHICRPNNKRSRVAAMNVVRRNFGGFFHDHGAAALFVGFRVVMFVDAQVQSSDVPLQSVRDEHARRMAFILERQIPGGP